LDSDFDGINGISFGGKAGEFLRGLTRFTRLEPKEKRPSQKSG
jgi:hypothetical protein